MSTLDNPSAAYQARVAQNIADQQQSKAVQATSAKWLRQTHDLGYDYNFTWMGRPVLQLPQDLVALQEIVFAVQPDVIIETGVAHGGSAVFFASLLHLLDLQGDRGAHGNRLVVGIDIDVRAHNRAALEDHVLGERIRLIEGSSTDDGTLESLAALLAEAFPVCQPRVMVVLDSDHEEAHVLAELERYGPLVTDGSYLVVCDTAIEDLGEDACPNRSWGPGNSPKSAVHKFLAGGSTGFELDEGIDHKLLLTNSPHGYLRCRR